MFNFHASKRHVNIISTYLSFFFSFFFFWGGGCGGVRRGDGGKNILLESGDT